MQALVRYTEVKNVRAKRKQLVTDSHFPSFPKLIYQEEQEIKFYEHKYLDWIGLGSFSFVNRQEGQKQNNEQLYLACESLIKIIILKIILLFFPREFGVIGIGTTI